MYKIKNHTFLLGLLVAHKGAYELLLLLSLRLHPIDAVGKK